MIEKFIEEQEQQLSTAVESKKSYSLLSNDLKFHAPLSWNSSISLLTNHQQEKTTTTKRSFDQVDNDDEKSSSSKKISINTKTSSVDATATIV